MNRTSRICFAIAAVLGLVAGGYAWSRVAPLPSFLDVKVVRAAEPGAWDLLVTARGSGTMAPITVSTAAGPLRVVGTSSVEDLASGRTATFRLVIDDTAQRCVVRVDLAGPDSHTYDLPVGDQP